jgi:hypothetical protein
MPNPPGKPEKWRKTHGPDEKLGDKQPGAR